MLGLRGTQGHQKKTNRFTLVHIRTLNIICLFLYITCTATAAWSEKKYESPLNGKIIRGITIKVYDIFEDPEFSAYRVANSIKVNTKEWVVRQELLFSEGDVYDEFRIRESERRLRDLKYLRNIHIDATPDGDSVDLVVNVQDTWTLIPQLAYSSGTGKNKKSVGLAESNLLGMGKRLESSYTQDESREIVEGVYEDNRFLKTQNRFLGAYFHRNDGDEEFIYYGLPFRTLVDKRSWYFNYHRGDTIGRLFKDGSEDYIFRQENMEFNARYALARGEPENLVQRFSFGYDYVEDRFEQADGSDYNDLDLDPQEVSNDPARLAENRRYSGPVLAYEYNRARFISMNYIDRFDRVEDYNLGTQYNVTTLFAPSYFGSEDDALIFNANASRGRLISSTSFLRGELGIATRYEDNDLVNTLARAEGKYYWVMGDLHIGELFVGKHTLASSAFLDYGNELDKDRQLTLGADNALRGYEARAFTGNKRYAINIEDRIHLYDDILQLVSVGAGVFFETGGATYESFGNMFGDYTYADVGAGLRFAFPRSSGGRVLRVDLAFPLRDADDGSNAFELRVVISGGNLFSARLRSETLGPERANVAVGFDR